MDGVVANFDKFVVDLLGYLAKFEETFCQDDWTKICKNQRLYSELSLYEHSQEFVCKILAVAKLRNYSVKFLTAVPRGNDMAWCFYDKINWAAQHFPGIPVWFGPYSADKHKHARPGDILIDDRVSNITNWNQAGGVGILHRGDFSQTLVQLAEILSRAD
jgi:5'(3')-deoxyribonucleotidase